jgi:mannose/fructose/N-acetylgalactosamine-specific phosphotransferase system component IIC
MKQDIDMPEDVRMGSYSDIRLAEHERVLKRALFVKVSMARSFGFSALMRWLSYSKVFVGFTAGFAFALALFGTAYLGRENSALADFNPLATGQAKANYRAIPTPLLFLIVPSSTEPDFANKLPA